MRWRVQQLRDKLHRQQRSVANRSQALTYEHQLCPSCGHPAGKDEKTCTRCGARLHGATVHKASRLFSALVPEGLPVVTMVYLAACVGLFLVNLKAVHDYQSQYAAEEVMAKNLMLIRYGANFRPLIEGYGEWWRLVTANFLHADVWHIAMNAYGLWVTGNVIEDRFGRARTAFVFLVTGVAGAGLSYLYGSGFAIGASTAGFGAMGFVVGHALRYRGRNTADLRERFIPWLLYGLIITFASTRVDVFGHLGGLAAGLVFGVILADKQQARRLPAWVWNLVMLACVVVVGWAFYEAAQFELEPHL